MALRNHFSLSLKQITALYAITCLCLFALPSSPVKAQLITDSDARLKTVEVQREGFLFTGRTQRKIRPSDKPQVDKKIKVRYSPGDPYGFVRLTAEPRYSTGHPFKVSAFKVQPRYSPGVPFRPRDLIQPSVRYSREMTFEKWQYAVKPRYSPKPPFEGEKYNIKPRYSITADFSVKRLWILRGIPLIPMHPVESAFKGPHHYKKPGLNDGRAMNNFKSFRVGPSFNIWVLRNLPDKSGIDGKISKPKFDKKEREIWNN